MHLKPGSYCYTLEYNAYRFFLGIGNYVNQKTSFNNVYLFFNLQCDDIWPSGSVGDGRASALTYGEVFTSPSSGLIGIMYDGYPFVSK